MQIFVCLVIHSQNIYIHIQVYISNLGFARFCSSNYSADLADARDNLVHLTNVSIQKRGEDYNSLHGNKWPLDCLRLYLEAMWGNDKAKHVFS